MTTTDEQALCAAIAANPDDDTVRLAYADWLGEQDEVRVKCPPQPIGPGGAYKCPKCFNSIQNAIPSDSPDHRRCASCKHVWQVTGTVLDTSRRDRAELIRLQIRMAGELCHVLGDTTRSAELLRLHADTWRPEVLREREDPIGACDFGSGTVYPEPDYLVRILEWRRGFPAVVEMTTDTFMAGHEKRLDVGKCPTCTDKTGFSWGPLADCRACNGTGRRTVGDGFAARLARAVPLEGVRLSDGVLQINGGAWHIRALVPPHQSTVTLAPGLYASEELAHAALSDAAVKFAREEAFGTLTENSSQ